VAPLRATRVFTAGIHLELRANNVPVGQMLSLSYSSVFSRRFITMPTNLAVSAPSYFVLTAGVLEGPLGLKTLLIMRKIGGVDDTTLVREEGSDEWTPLKAFLKRKFAPNFDATEEELFALAESAQPSEVMGLEHAQLPGSLYSFDNEHNVPVVTVHGVCAATASSLPTSTPRFLTDKDVENSSIPALSHLDAPSRMRFGTTVKVTYRISRNELFQTDEFLEAVHR